jgi:hypothetical protein
MNRRGFLAALAALPFVGKLVPKTYRVTLPRTPLPPVKWRRVAECPWCEHGQRTGKHICTDCPRQLVLCIYCDTWQSPEQMAIAYEFKNQGPDGTGWEGRKGICQACEAPKPQRPESSWVAIYRRIHEFHEELPWRRG